MTLGSLVLALVAGMLSVLSPCVLPILPIVLGAAASERKWGPVALAIGLSVSFVAIGVLVATVGFAVGLNAEVFRYVAAVLMVGIGLFLMLPGFQAQLAVASGPIANWADARFSGVRSGASASSGSACCSVPSGAPVSARRWARLPCLQRRAVTSGRSASSCSHSE